MKNGLIQKQRSVDTRPSFLQYEFDRRATQEITMENASTILLSIIDGDLPESSIDFVTESLSEKLFERISEKSWFPQKETDWGKQIARRASEILINKTTDLKKRKIGVSAIRKILADYLNNPVKAIYLTSEAIHLIYSESNPEWHGFVEEGANYHCRLIRRAVAQVVRKHIAGMKRISIDAQELEDELFGVVMEETVRCLSDPSARVWSKNNRTPAVFPSEGTRGMRRGMLMRVALCKKGKRLAAVRSDRHIFIWDINANEVIRSWDMTLLDRDADAGFPNSLYFSQCGSRLAVETDKKQVYVLNVEENDSYVFEYCETGRDEFLSEFGAPFIPDRSITGDTNFQIQTRDGKQTSLKEYRHAIYDWSFDGRIKKATTASEIDRIMPDWMQKAGFERAVFHIAQKRLIDLIRKRTHTNYACWRCGSMVSSATDERCRRCGADFTRCPMGCKNTEPLSASNRWQCSQCGMASRTGESAVQVEMEDWFADSIPSQSDWRDGHDMERILSVLKHASLAYKKKDIPCDRLVAMKAEGKTNEEIGSELGIPRGSVDYIWNQCKQKILLAFGEESL